jgi:hypothetical protein
MTNASNNRYYQAFLNYQIVRQGTAQMAAEAEAVPENAGGGPSRLPDPVPTLHDPAVEEVSVG